MNTYSQMYAKRVDNIRNLKLERERTSDALRGAMKSLAEDVAERLRDIYEVEVEDHREMRGIYNGIPYRILRISPDIDDWRDNLTLGVDIMVERVDNYKPTDKEKRMLANRPKQECRDFARTISWLERDAYLYEWGNLKNKIFQRLEYRWDVYNDNFLPRIENLNLSLVPIDE